MLSFAKAQAYGNDFLYVSRRDVRHLALDQLAREMCDRHRGAGADGLIAYERTGGDVAMQLFNADGGRAEVSGNGVRALAALILRDEPHPSVQVSIRTEGGLKILERLEHDGTRQTFRAAMGSPTDVDRRRLSVGDERLDVVVVNVGNPHCVLLGPLPARERFEHLGAGIARHPAFPRGTNVEFVHVEYPDRLRILIWERGAGPTTSSGTGSCASLVAAAAYGGADRDAQVAAPGGTQRVEWKSDGIFLTGWAEVVFEGRWMKRLPVSLSARGSG